MATAAKRAQGTRHFVGISLLASASWFAEGVVVAEEPRASNPPAAGMQQAPGEASASSASDVNAILGRAVDLERQGQYEDAIRQYQRALEVSPQNVTTHNNLAWLLATCPVDRLRNGKQATIHAARACEITEWKHPSTIDTLSIALAEAGQFEKAIELLTKLRAGASATDREKIDRRMAMFRAGKTYRQAEPASPPPAAPSRAAESKLDAELAALLREAMALERAGRLGDAAVQYGKAMDRARRVLGPEHLAIAQLMVRQGDTYFYSGQFEKALPLFREALPALRKHLARNHAAVTYCVNQLASAYDNTGQYGESLRLGSENLAVREASLAKDHPHVLISLSNVALARIRLGQYEEAVPLFAEWLARNERGQGERNPNLPIVLKMMGGAYDAVGNGAEAEKCYTRALAMLKAQGNTDCLEEAEISRSLAMVCRGTAKPDHFEEVREHAARAVAITTKVCGQRDFRTAAAKGALAIVHQRFKKFAEAEPLFLEAVQAMDDAMGKDNAQATLHRMELARLYLEMDRADEAETICAHCVDVIEARYGAQQWEFPGVERSLVLLAEIAGRTGRQDQVQSRLERLADAVEKRLGKEHPLLAKIFAQSGEAYMTLGRNAEAQRCFRRCSQIQRATLGPDHPDLALSQQRSGLLCVRAARYAEAEPFYDECLRICRKRLGEEHPRVASALCDLGFLYTRMNRYAEAEKAFEQAVAIAKKHPGVAADILQAALGYWGRLCNETGRFDMAESLLKQALALAEETHGRQHPSVAWNRVYLAQLYWGAKRYAEAEPLYREAITIFEATEGKGHPDTHVPLTDLGGVLSAMGRYDEAEPLLRQSLGRQMNQRDRVCTLEALAEVHLKRGRSEEAIRSATEAERAHRDLLNHVLPALSPAEQMVYLSSTWRKSLSGWLSIGLAHSKRAEAVGASAEWLLNGKSLSAELLAEQFRLARQADDPALAATARELAAVRGQLAHLVLSPSPSSGGAEGTTTREQLARRELELARQLGRQTLLAARESSWITLDEVRKNVPAQSVLIEIARFGVYRMHTDKPGGEWDRAHYVAWVIPPAGVGNVAMVDLGDAEAVDEAVARCRQSVESLPQTVGSVGLGNATKSAMVNVARLSELVWKPLAVIVGNVQSLVVSPDGALWLYPWEALSDEQGRYLVETRRIRYVVTGRQMADRRAREVGREAVIFADPDYDAEPVGSALRERDAWSEASRSLLKAGTPQGLLGNARAERLRDGAADVEAYSAALGRYMAGKPRVYRDKEASESEFRMLKSPRVLVIDTHGFFLPDQAFDNMPLTAEARGKWARYQVDRLFGFVEDSQPIVPNPLLRCGLVLAGANRRHRAAGANDGVLTGLEILGTDLSGTELVVLDACETGVGAVRDAEGAAGLRYAFQLAGAETVIATAWPVLVKSSSEFMRTFFDNLAKKQTRTEALHNAQVSLLRRVRETTGSGHPALWAGYTIIGGGE